MELDIRSGVHDPSNSARSSQLPGGDPGTMDTNGGFSSMENGARTMEPENNLTAFGRGSEVSTNTGQPSE